jgi:TPR repeat protein
MHSILKSLLVFVLLAEAGFAADDFAETKKKAEAGDAYAQCSLGYMYKEPNGVPRDYAEAMKWFRLAAEQGNVGAQNGLGFMYAKGDGVPKDLVQAHVWFNIAAANGNESAKTFLTNVEKEMTFSEKAEAMKLARDLFAKLPKGN